MDSHAAPHLRVLLAPLLAALTAFAGCGGPPPPVERVVLITCDTLRADRLGLYGYGAPTSPNLDRLAGEGVVFDAAYSSAPWTRPALSSLMTGRYAEEVGAAPSNLRRMPAEVETLAERVAAAGIATAAIVSNGLIARPPAGGGDDVDLAQGFATYDDAMTALEQNRDMPERPAPDTTDAALGWLARHASAGGGRLFLWVHYQDPHGPYTPPDELAGQFQTPLGENEPDPKLPIGSTLRGLGQIPLYQKLEVSPGVPEQRPRVYRDRYDAEIAYFDRELGRLLDALRADPAWERTLVIFSSDHGESLGEHDHWFCHGENVQREVVRVPLVLRYPQGRHGPSSAASPDRFQRVSAVVGHVDVWPTVLAAFDLDPGGSRGLALLGDDLPEGRVLAQSFLPQDPKRRQWAATDGRWRLVWGESSAPRLYDLASDPDESRDVAARHPDELERLRARYQASQRLFGSQAHEGSEVELDPATRRALQKLGYIELEAQE
jgi:arylsulfatase A-like enzyme